MALVVFALTGGIGSGKSSVARRFAEQGVPIVDADELAREVVRPGSAGLRQIRERFGSTVVQPDGTLDRAKLGERVFGNPEDKAALEAITHPAIRAHARERFDGLRRAGEPLACYVVPLLYERGLEAEYSPVVVVNATREQQLARAAARDGASPEQIAARLRSQLPLTEKVRRADYVIDNTGSRERALADADRVLAAICERLGLDPARYPAPAARV